MQITDNCCIARFIEGELKLQVNQEKSTVDRPWKLNFPGFSFYWKKGGIGIRVHQKPVAKLKQRLKEITGRSNALSMPQRTTKLKQVIIGWVNYFGIADMGELAKSLDMWLRRRIRMCFWKQWKKIKTKHSNLMALGTPIEPPYTERYVRWCYPDIGISGVRGRWINYLFSSYSILKQFKSSVINRL